jgi:hypothetical protein
VTRPFWRRWLLPVFAVLLALNALALVGWTLPQLYRQRYAASRAEAARREVARLREVAAALRGRAQAIRGNGVDYQRFYERYAGDERRDLLPTIQAIEEMTSGPGLKTRTRSFRREPMKGTGLERVQISLPLEGTYDQFVAFLGQVERSPRFLTVDRVAMRSDAEGEASLTVDISAYLKTGQAPEQERRPRAR